MKIPSLCLLLTFLGLTAFGQYIPRDKVIVDEQLIFPLQKNHVHGSSIVALPNGDLLAAWFEGSGERTADDVRIMGARLRRRESQWGAPFLLADTPGIPDCNPVMFLNQEGKLFLVWIAVQANRWEQSIIRLRTSTAYDNAGAPIWNWQDNILLKPGSEFHEEVVSKFSELPENNSGWAEYAPKYDDMIIEASKDSKKTSIGWMTRIKPLVLQSGRMLLPLYSDGFNLSMVAISDDDGATWTPSLPIVGRGPIQPALAQREDGEIMALMRDSGDAPNRLQRSFSTDEGMTWSAAEKSSIPNTASVELLTLDNGLWVFLGNDVDDGRYKLSMYVSDDEGRTWRGKIYLEDEKKGFGGFSYPSLIQDVDGIIHATYSYHLENGDKSIKYVKIDPNNFF
ncbi:Predicted neuraminidase (sialidase) [Cyclobacterium lianum]|uniref:Predicted neuraminidase (Sialidase) n=1 Tax=Cyclobacterium lianum TaxID=388280 RepID=A0A1M7Q3E7_9BACT|nr:sialidase family protein [Cyclobacterium lianum]SHN24778.1 Predicted neuraminidase (sialidase) [Cyclobacterium lianum]